MHLRKPTLAPFFVVLVLWAGFMAGCGGGQSGGDSQEQGDGGQGEEEPPQESKTALGTIQRVNTEAKRFTLEPSAEEQGKEPQAFKLTPQAKITLGDKQAELADMEKGQQANVEYIVLKDLNRVRSVQLFEGGGDSGSGG